MGSRQHLQKTVLVVDDMPLIRFEAVSMWENMGFRVIEACDGREALSILETTSAMTILFTDIEMPNMNGLELASIVAERWPAIAILITSGRLKPSANDLPVDAQFLPKPYSPNMLQRMVN